MIILHYIHAGYDVHTCVCDAWMMILFMIVSGTPKHMRLNELSLGVLVLELCDQP